MEISEMGKDMVGVLVSHGYGAGWSTWNDVDPQNEELVEAFENDLSDDEKIAIAERIYPDAYHGGLLQCKAHYLPKGTQYRIDEYDGAESLELNYDSSWRIA